MYGWLNAKTMRDIGYLTLMVVRSIIPDSLTKRVLEKLSRVGPSVSRIAKEIGASTREVSSVYHGLLKNNFTFHAVPNYSALGLKKAVMITTPSADLEPVIGRVFNNIDKTCYLTTYAKGAQAGHYIFHFNIPKKFESEFADLVARIERLGLISKTRLYLFDWYRWLPMRTKHYDFTASSWSFDWNSMETQTPDRQEVLDSKEEQDRRIDPLDITILEELRSDATCSLAKIYHKLVDSSAVIPYFGKSKKVGDYSLVDASYNTLRYHYDHHVLDGGLINGYRVNWSGTRAEEGYRPVNIVCRNIAEQERTSLMRLTEAVPFAWSEAGGHDSYYASFSVPANMLVESLHHLSDALAPLGDRAELRVLDETKGGTFKMPTSLYRIPDGWQCDGDIALARFQEAIAEAKANNKIVD